MSSPEVDRDEEDEEDLPLEEDLGEGKVPSPDLVKDVNWISRGYIISQTYEEESEDYE